MVKVQRIGDGRMLISKQHISITLPSPKAQKSSQKRGQKDCMTQRYQTSVFRTWPGICTYELSVVVTVYTNLHKLHPDKFPAWRRGGGKEVPCPAKELVGINSFWQRDSQLSLRVEPLLGWSCFSESHTSKSIWAAQIEFDGFEIKWGHSSVVLEGGVDLWVVERDKYDQNILYGTL